MGPESAIGATSIGLLVLVWIASSVMVIIVAGKCGQSPWPYGFLSLVLSPLIASLLLIVGAKHTEEGRTRAWSPNKVRGAMLGVLVISFASFVGASTLPALSDDGFTDDDIAKVKESIKKEFERTPGSYRVTKVEMIRETKKKLTGFATLKLDDTMDVTKPCNAVYGDGKYIWRCQ